MTENPVSSGARTFATVRNLSSGLGALRVEGNSRRAAFLGSSSGYGQQYSQFGTTVKRNQTENAATEAETEQPLHNIIKDSEKAVGEVEKREFQAETRMLLDIVAKSLYSESEIFIRELISNASDALEKFRYLSLSGENLEKADRPLEIHLQTDKMTRTFTIQDTGIGMTKEEMIENLGTIAKSGSKAFIQNLKESKGGPDPSNIIGQFGVGFYSAFMVAKKVEVFSRSSKPGSVGYKWSSDGTGTYEIAEAEGVDEGTKIVVHLKGENRTFADEHTVKDIIKRYSNFVGSPIYLNGEKINSVQALWLLDPKTVTKEEHNEFYRFVSGSYDLPRFTLHFRTDVPLSLRCLLYVPDGKPGLFDMGREDVGVSLYSRKVLIKNRADNIIPQWLRFLKGVVDSEDIPLNLSRELLQEGSLIKKLQRVVVNKVLRFFQERAQKEPEEFAAFFRDYGVFLKEGIIAEPEQLQKEEIAKLLQFESSSSPSGQTVTLPQYINRLQPDDKHIYYLAAPSRDLADASPYLEAMREKNKEVLYCFQPYDEAVLLQLGQFCMKTLVSVEKEMRNMKDTLDLNALPFGSLPKEEAESLVSWMTSTLKGRASVVKLTSKLDTHPCVVTVEEMAAARHFVRTQFAQVPADSRYSILQPHFEINIKHPLIKKLAKLKDTDTQLATMITEQLFSNAMVIAGLEQDTRSVVSRLNDLLTKAVEKL